MKRPPFFLAAAFMLTSCYQDTPMGTTPDITGTIKKIRQASTLTIEKTGAIEVSATEEGNYDTAIVVISTDTDIRHKDNRVSFGHLEKGQTVRVWFKGPVRESYPVQATAERVEIVQR